MVLAGIKLRLLRASLACTFGSDIDAVVLCGELRAGTVKLASTLAVSATTLRLLGFFTSVDIRVVSFTFIRSLALNVVLELALERFKIHVFLLFFLLIPECFGLFNLDLVDDVQRPAIVSLQIGAPELVNVATLFDGFEEAVTDVRNHVLVQHFVQVTGDFLTQSETLLA